MAGFGDPGLSSMPQLEYVLKGIKVDLAKRSVTQRSRLPITPSILRKIRSVLSEESAKYENIMLWAICCTCFFGFLRSGEATTPAGLQYDPGAHLSYGDVSLDSNENPSLARVSIKASKTDPFRKGVAVYLGRTNNDLCPVTALAAYLAVRGTLPGPFFLLANGCPLTREMFVTRVKALLTKAGLNSAHYSGHSFRIGAATTAAALGVEDSLIKTLGRWQSSAYLLYVRVPRERLALLSQTLACSAKYSMLTILSCSSYMNSCPIKAL